MSELNENLVETVSLQVNIPHDCEVGSTINVEYEGKYYQVIIPQNAPGSSIQVVLPIVKAINVNLVESDSDVTTNDNVIANNVNVVSDNNVIGDVDVVDAETIVLSDDLEHQNSVKVAKIIGVSIVVIATLLLGPVVVGIIILTGVVIYSVSKMKRFENTAKKFAEKLNATDLRYKISERAIKSWKKIDTKHEISKKILNLDTKYEITDNLTKLYNYSIHKLNGTTNHIATIQV